MTATIDDCLAVVPDLLPGLVTLERRARRAIEGAEFQMGRNAGPDGIMTKTWPAGVMMAWVAGMLIGDLILHHVQDAFRAASGPPGPRRRRGASFAAP